MQRERFCVNWTTVANVVLLESMSLLCLLGSYRMRPRSFQAERPRDFLGSKFGGRFDDGSERVTHRARIFTVSVIDAPKLVAGLWYWNCARLHGDSSPEP